MKSIIIIFSIVSIFLSDINSQKNRMLSLHLEVIGKNKYQPSLEDTFGYYDPIQVELFLTNNSNNKLTVNKLYESKYLTFEIRIDTSNIWKEIKNRDYTKLWGMASVTTLLKPKEKTFYDVTVFDEGLRIANGEGYLLENMPSGQYYLRAKYISHILNEDNPEMSFSLDEYIYSNEIPIQIYNYSNSRDQVAIKWFKKENTLLVNPLYDPQNRIYKNEVVDERYFMDLLKKKEEFIQQIPNSYYSDYFKWEVANTYITLFREGDDILKDDENSELNQYLVKAEAIANNLLETTTEAIYKNRAQILLKAVENVKELHKDSFYRMLKELKNKKND